VTVLQSFPPPRRTTNPYLVQLLASLPPHVHASGFSWRTALTGRYDVLHVHWPETMLRASTPLRTLSRQVRFAALLTRLTLRRTAVVRTLHNTAPHEQGPRVERALLRWCDRRTTLWVRLNPTTTPPSDAPVETILHGHYRDWFASYPRPEPVPGRLVFFGLVRPYKGVERLLEAFAAVPGDDVSLRVVGNPTTPGVRAAVEQAALDDPRVSARLEYVDDDVVAHEVGSAELVVLPYREVHNSGAALLALSLDRPVLLTAGPSVAELATEVGPGWVSTFPGDLTGEDLTRALDAARTPGRTARPDLGAREWPDLGSAHAAAYARAVDRAHARGPRRPQRVTPPAPAPAPARTSQETPR
jgi:beta-1,4-mannosyltransferase